MTPYGFDFTLGLDVESRYRKIVPAVLVDCAVSVGAVVGVVMGVGTEVRGFTPRAVLFALLTPALSEIVTAYGRTSARAFTYSVLNAATVAAVFVLGDVISA